MQKAHLMYSFRYASNFVGSAEPTHCVSRKGQNGESIDIACWEECSAFVVCVFALRRANCDPDAVQFIPILLQFRVFLSLWHLAFLHYRMFASYVGAKSLCVASTTCGQSWLRNYATLKEEFLWDSLFCRSTLLHSNRYGYTNHIK